ncbi:MAG: hypothetical protein WBB28_20665 [Crinalium sp.]
MDVTKLNLPLFEQLKRKIREESFFFSIGDIINRTECGTVACVAGHTYLILYPDPELEYNAIPWDKLRDTVANELGITAARRSYPELDKNSLTAGQQAQIKALGFRVDNPFEHAFIDEHGRVGVAQVGQELFILDYWCEPFKSQYREKAAEIARILESETGCDGGGDPDVEEDEVMYTPDVIHAAIANAHIKELKKEMAEITCKRIDYYAKTGR